MEDGSNHSDRLKRIKKYVLKIAGLMLLLFFVTGLTAVTAEAAGFLPEDKVEAFYNRYDLWNYMLDFYVDLGGNWLPWNWASATLEGILAVFMFLINILWMGMVVIFYVVGIVFQEIYQLDVISALTDQVTDYVRSLAGIGNDGLTGGGLYSQLLVLIILTVAAYLVYLFFKRQTGKMINQIVVFFLTFILGFGFFVNCNRIVNEANDFSKGLSNAVIAPVAGMAGYTDTGNYAVTIREEFFDVTIYKPYLLLQFGTTEGHEEEAVALLSLDSGNEVREEIVSNLASWFPLMGSALGLVQRLVYMVVIFIVNVIASVVVTVLACIGIYHQVLFLFYFITAPFVLTAGCLPSVGTSIIKKWINLTLYELFVKVGITMILTITFVFASVAFEIGNKEAYIIGALLQSVVYIAAFCFRGKLFGLFFERVPKVESLSGMVGKMYMLNRFFRFHRGSGNYKGQSGNAGNGKQNTGRILETDGMQKTAAGSIQPDVTARTVKAKGDSRGIERTRKGEKNIDGKQERPYEGWMRRHPDPLKEFHDKQAVEADKEVKKTAGQQTGGDIEAVECMENSSKIHVYTAEEAETRNRLGLQDENAYRCSDWLAERDIERCAESGTFKVCYRDGSETEDGAVWNIEEHEEEIQNIGKSVEERENREGGMARQPADGNIKPVERAGDNGRIHVYTAEEAETRNRIGLQDGNAYRRSDWIAEQDVERHTEAETFKVYYRDDPEIENYGKQEKMKEERNEEYRHE